jgi:ribosomal protein S18 acetylase RimI-like enzyme
LTPEVRALEPDDVGWLADLHNAAFGDYPVPAVLDAPALQSYMTETDVDPALSRVAFVGGSPASFCLGAVRGDRASIRGEGTHPAHRRLGLGRLVLDETLSALAGTGAGAVTLEVLNGNDAAMRLYRQSGFEQRRRLLGYTLGRPRRGIRARLSGDLSECDTEAAVASLERWGWDGAPWQLQAESLARVPAYRLDDRAVVLGRRRGDRFWLYAMGVDPARRRHGLATRALSQLSAGWIGIPALVPEEWWEAGALLRSLGAASEQHWQWEMVRSLA